MCTVSAPHLTVQPYGPPSLQGEPGGDGYSGRFKEIPGYITIVRSMDRFEQGKQQMEMMSGHKIDSIFGVDEIAPDLARYTLEFPYGDVLRRPGLALKLRQVATVAALTALGNAPVQLNAHINMALNVGCSREEIVEIITQMAVYAGFPAALNGMNVAKEVFHERDRNGLS